MRDAGPDAPTIHEQVRDLYGAAAKTSTTREPHPMATALYGQEDLPAGALAASLGCANLAVLVELPAGSTVVDLGSGGGVDALACARRVGPAGRVIGVDLTQ